MTQAPNDTPSAEQVEAAPADLAADPSILGDAKPGDPAGDEKAADAAPAADGDGAAAAAGDDKVADADAPAAPYEGLTAPEGSTLNAESLVAVTPILRGLGVETTEQAQGVIDQVTPVITDIVTRSLEGFVAEQEANALQQRRDWATAARDDAEVGGANFDRSVARAALAMDKLFSPDFRDVLKATGFDNHPEMLRGLARAGDALSEDSIHRPDGGKQQLSTAQKLYGEAFSPQ